MPEAGLSLGSNLGDKAGTIEAALLRLDSGDVRVLRRSRLYRTEPWGNPDQDWFLNACAIVRTELPPNLLLQHCLAIEQELGRKRTEGLRWGPRAIDIDILFHGETTTREPGLELPHPRMFDRAFVLVPLAEIAGERMVSGRRISDAVRTVGTDGVTVWQPD